MSEKEEEEEEIVWERFDMARTKSILRFGLPMEMDRNLLLN